MQLGMTWKGRTLGQEQEGGVRVKVRANIERIDEDQLDGKGT